MKDAFVMKNFYRHDVLINMPITRDHSDNKFTGALKNLMRLNSSESNNGFYKDGRDTNAVEFIDQCIVA